MNKNQTEQADKWCSTCYHASEECEQPNPLYSEFLMARAVGITDTAIAKIAKDIGILKTMPFHVCRRHPKWETVEPTHWCWDWKRSSLPGPKSNRQSMT